MPFAILQVAGSPELYPVLVEGSGVSTLMSLLPHDNTDIGIEVLELFKELTDAGVYKCFRGRWFGI